MNSIETYISKLRSKPEHIRHHIALWSSLGISVLIFLFWLGGMTGTNTQVSDAVARTVQNTGSPASSLVANVASFFGDIKDLVFTPKKVTYSTVEVRPGK